MNKIQSTYRIDSDVHKAFKLVCLQDDISVARLIEKLVKAYLKQRARK